MKFMVCLLPNMRVIIIRVVFCRLLLYIISMFEYHLNGVTFASETVDLRKHFEHIDMSSGKSWADFCIQRNFSKADIALGIRLAEKRQHLIDTGQVTVSPWGSLRVGKP